MKKVLITLLAVCAACCAFAFVACGSKTETELSDFADKTVNAEYGSTYTVEKYAYDKGGVAYELTAEIKDDAGKKVSTNSFGFVVEKPSYTVKYTAKDVGGSPTKTITVNAFKKPIITVDKSEKIVNVDVDGFYIPQIKAYDQNDAEITNVTKEIYYSGYTGDVKTDYNGTDERYKPSKAGTYYLLITATDEKGFKNAEKVVFYGKSYGTDPCIKMTEEYAARVTNFTRKTSGTLVKNADLPDNSVYSGDAVKIDVNSADKIYMSLNYSPRALSELNQEQYNRVRIPVYFKANEEKLRYFVINGDQDKLSNPCFLFNNFGKKSVANLMAYANKWFYIDMSLDEFVECCGGKTETSTDLFLLKTYQEGVKDENGNVIATVKETCVETYIGDVSIFYQNPTLFIAAEDTTDKIVATNTEKTFANNATLKTLFTDVGAYSGGAVKINRVGGQELFVKLGLNLDALNKIKGNYTHVTFRVGVVYGANTTGVWVNTNDKYKHGAITQTGLVVLENTKWYTLTLSIQDFISAVNGDEVSMMMGGANGSYEIYFGDIEMYSKSDNLGEDKTWR